MYGFIQRGNTRTEYYQEVAIKATKKGKCGCGKMRTRTMTFSQTISPFNKNKETGELKTREDILVEIKQERDKWLADTDIACEGCFRKK
jgi:hypothetical protein